MREFLNRFRDWWHQPVVAATATQTEKIQALCGQLTELNQQIDFLKYELSGLLSDEAWRQLIKRLVVKPYIAQLSES